MKISDLTRCRIYGHSKLLIAIPLLFNGSHWATEAWNRGGMMNYLIATNFHLAWYWFYQGWMNFLNNECFTVFCSDDWMIFRQQNGYVFSTEIKDVKKIKKDRWGYTLYLDKLGRCRFPRWQLCDDLERVFDAHHAKLAGMKQPRPRSLPSDPA